MATPKFVTRNQLKAIFDRTQLKAVVERANLKGFADRVHLKAVGTTAAFALMVGLAAPASGFADSLAAQATDTSSSTSADQASAAPAADPKPAGVAQQAADAVAAAVAPAPAAPSDAELHPVAVTADQQTFTPTAEQMSNAKAIVNAGKALNLPPRAWTIAIATSLQETGLKNLGDLGANNDHDSLGLFQQRPSSGWGTPDQVMDPTYAATAFYKGLVQVPGWQSIPLTDAAQAVQVSAFPDHYAKHEVEAGDIIDGLYGTGPFAGVAGS
jgi:hypothetical protein